MRRSLVLLALLLAGCTTQPTAQPAAAPTAQPAAVERATAAPAATIAPAAAPVPSAPPPPADAALNPSPAAPSLAALPAPIYFMDAKRHIARIERDVSTTTLPAIVPPAPADVDSFVELAAAPDGRSLAFTASAVGLTIIDAGGAQRAVFPGSIESPAWHPDSASVAARWTDGPAGPGVYRFPIDGGAPALLQPDTAPTADSPGLSLAPLSYAPDGATLLLSTSIADADFCGIALHPLGAPNIIPIAMPGGLTSYSAAVWTADGQGIILTQQSAGAMAALLPGLWRASTATGAVTPFADESLGDTAALYAYFASSGQGLLGFRALVPTYDPLEVRAAPFPLQMVRVGADGTSAVLPPEERSFAFATWAPDGSGALVWDEQTADSSARYVPADGAPAVPLPTIRWPAVWGRP